MNDRERFSACMHYQPVDRIPLWDFGFWEETLKRWRQEGLPRDVHLNTYFGMDRQWEIVPVNVGMVPPFDEEILEVDELTETVINYQGIKMRRRKDGGSIPKFIEFPVKDRKTFLQMAERYNAKSPCRYPEEWEERVRIFKQRDYPVGIFCGSFFGWVRDWMGLENLSLAFYDDPLLVHEMFQFLADFFCETIQRALKEVEINYAHFWEDMAYNHASLISPRMFREFLIPRYRQVVDLLHSHGIDVIIVDCDGNIQELVPLWLDVGVNTMFPVEIRAGNDPLEMRREYGRELRMMGGIDKRALAKGRKEIEIEVMARVPLIEEGGYIPFCDHRVPPDVPFENYLYYLRVLKKVAGIR